jgi:hypothetical protein
MICFGILLMFCEPQTVTQAATKGATFCQTARAIYWDRADTRKTKEQVDSHNRVFKKLCAKK